MIAYKVVRVTGHLWWRKRLSVVINNPDWQMEYKPDEWAKAKTGGLFVFKSLPAARIFSKNSHGCKQSIEIWRCKVAKPRFVPPQIMPLTKRSILLQEFWLTPDHPKWPWLLNTPCGTALYDRVMLLRRMRR